MKCVENRRSREGGDYVIGKTAKLLAQKLVFHNSDFDLYNFININALLAIVRSLQLGLYNRDFPLV
jgi:hypothetical protein